jgi:hypothetical protein
MKIVFTSYHETYSKENTKNYIPNSYVLVFLINVPWNLFQENTKNYILNSYVLVFLINVIWFFFFAYNLRLREYFSLYNNGKNIFNKPID